MKTITITSTDPDFCTPEIKSLLRRKNTLMHKGHVEEANSVAEKIGKLIINKNTNQLTSQNTDITNFDLWAAVKRVIGKKRNYSSHLILLQNN